jgi:prephenate dehydrogenase
MDVLVVGAGAMGRWFASVAADVGDVALADVDPAAAEAAAETVGGRAVPLDGGGTFDVVCVAVPIPAAADAVERQAGRAERALLDVTGVMAPAVTAMRAAAPDRERVSLHPLFAPDAEPGSVAVVADAPGPVTDEVRAAVAARGNDTFETTVEDHDAAMESVQAAAHAAVLAYGLATEDVREEFHTPVSEQLEALLARVSGGEPRVYADVQAAFDGAEAVAAAAGDVAAADHDAFERLYAAAGERADADRAVDEWADQGGDGGG